MLQKKKSGILQILRSFCFPCAFTLGLIAFIASCGGGGDRDAGGGGDAGGTQPTTLYYIGGNVSGLSGTLVLQNNGGDDLTISSDGLFEFDTPLSDSESYDVTILTSPNNQNCSCTNEVGVINGADIDDIEVACVDKWTHPNGGDISMITPYVNQSDMASVNEAFSSDDSTPWGFAHDGVDFFPIGNLKPFQAVCSGVVDKVELWQNNISSN